MSKTIFELVNKLNIKNEFERLENELNNKTYIRYCNRLMSIYSYINESGIFKEWKYRDTLINVNEYLIFLGIKNNDYEYSVINNKKFLYYLEFLINILSYMFLCDYDIYDNVSHINKNIIIIIDKMGYTIKTDFKNGNKKLFLASKDVDLDSIIDDIDEDVAVLLAKYNDFRIKNSLSEKHSILNKLAKIIEKNKKEYNDINHKIYNLIEKLVNNFGINHCINKKLENKLNEKQLLETYDDCYKLIIHLFRSLQCHNLVKKYNNNFEY